MKVITQLIRHFWQRGALTNDQAEYLLDQGFARLSDLPGFKPREVNYEVAPKPVLVPQPLELAGEALEKPRRKAGRGGPKGVVPEAEDLKIWLRKQFELRAAAFKSLVRLGEQYGECATWQEAAVRLRQAPRAKFGATLAAALRTRNSGLQQVWEAVDPEPFYSRMEDASLRGPTVRAFRMLLSINDASQLGKYSWILKLDEVQDTCNLLQAHRRLSAGLVELYRHHRSALKAALASSTHAVPQWALVLLHNAQRAVGSEMVAGQEYGPVSLPDDEVWEQAWTEALRMDGPAVTRLLANCYDRKRVGEGADCALPLYCPLDWKL